MLSESTITAVKELPAYQVIGRYITLKQSGSKYIGHCPFHNEKTPSFNVRVGNYKCFGCGKSGDAIAFVEEHQNLPFYEAIKKIANDNNVYIEETFDQSYSPEKRKEQQDKSKTAYALIAAGRREYSEYLQSDDEASKRVLKYLREDRKLTTASINHWKMGYAPHDFQFLTSQITTQDHIPIASEIGLVKQKDGRTYDTYRNRVIIPIENIQGAVIGFGGRDVSEIVPPKKVNADYEPAKYYNPVESFLYHKSSILFGLNRATKAIKEYGCANLVEGYMSVIRMHQFGMANTVATCGTALTADQAKILRRYTDRVNIIRDGDKAGLKATLRDIPILLAAGFRVFVVSVPDGKDPDDLCDHMEWNRGTIERMGADGIAYYIKHLTTTISDETARIEAVAAFLATISNPITRELYTTRVLDELGFKKKTFLDQIKQELKKGAKDGEEESTEDIGDVWYRRDKSIWIKSNKGWDYVTENFHIYIMYAAEDENEEIVWVLRLECDNGDNIYLEVLHKDFCSASKLTEIVATKMLSLNITSSQIGLLRSYLFNRTEFKKAIKVTRYGYHEKSGAFIFSNGAVVSCPPGEDGKAYKILKPDEFGMVQTDKHFLSMPNVKKNSREAFTITDFQITFDEWYLIYSQAHTPQHAFIAACWKIMSLFRDIALRHQSFSPILFFKGGAGTGKSSIIRSLTCLNGYPPKEINLKGKNSEPGIIRTMSASSNSVIWMDEFVNQHPFEGILQAAYDNAGQVKASGSSGLELDNVELKSALALTSNFQPENPIFFSRCLYNTVLSQTKTKEQKKKFDELKELEDRGLAQVTIELIQHRALIEENYSAFFNLLYQKLKSHPTFQGESVPERLFSNMAQTLTGAFILARKGVIHLTETVSREDVLQEFVESGVQYISRQFKIQSEKTSLHEFFEILQLLYDESKLFEVMHFKLEADDQIAFRFGSLYTLFKLRYRNVHFREAPDKESIRDEICKFTGIPEETLFTQIRFAADYGDNTNNKTVPIKDSFRCSYKLIEEKFGVDFKSRKIDKGLTVWRGNEREAKN